MRLIAIAVGGAIGALLRYALSNVAYRVLNPAFPWGTAMVNLSGAFAIGLLSALLDRVIVAPYVRTFLLIGLIGSFTTFSTYMIESVNLLQDQEYGLAALNIVLSTLLGLLLVFAGMIAGRAIMGIRQ
ncbi:MAG: fluoride efflux transporter CrcB [Candidatus Latescibacteria bacterium]|nr:fluoride efflux transporter CrcB [Candidatus Latescibacterota bacterium]OPX21557.1 MAG: hypothetical protein B1H02_07430 [Candidatus Latescibacteria bacterium 4484_107]